MCVQRGGVPMVIPSIFIVNILAVTALIGLMWVRQLIPDDS